MKPFASLSLFAHAAFVLAASAAAPVWAQQPGVGVLPDAQLSDQQYQALLQQREQARAQSLEHINRLRADIQGQQATAEQACWQRFAVEDCLRNVRRQSREALKPLRDRELEINSQARQDKTDARLRSIARKQAEAAEQAQAPLSVESREPVIGPQVESQRQAEARARAQEQQERLQQHQQEVQAHAQEEEQRRAQAAQQQREKVREAKRRIDSRADDIARHQNPPLPIPQGTPPQP